ncbi:MAG: class IV adenylate cyclase [Peptoniphilus sp.]|nr:class IV adenylate cyclase [Peptoniphilus sp.]
MEIEKEVKILGIDVAEAEKNLIKLGAKLISKEKQENILVDSSENPIEPKAQGYLRIRTSEDKINNRREIYFTFKKHITDVAVRENIEYTTKIESKEELINILKSMGYDIFDVGYKNRTSYELEGMRFDIDTWDMNTYPEPFIEIEFDKKERLYDILNKLNIDKNKISTKSIAELKKIYKNSMTY